MPTEQVSFFCASNCNPLCDYQCYMCKDKERELALQATTAAELPREMKMAQEKPLFLMVVHFEDGRIPFLERSNIENDLVVYAKELLRKDSKAHSVVIYKPTKAVHRAEFEVTKFD